MTENPHVNVRESLIEPELLRSIGAAWKLLLFLLLQSDITTKSYQANPGNMADALGVSLSTFISWVQRLESLNILTVKEIDEKVRLAFRPPFNKIIVVTEEGYGPGELKEITDKKKPEFDESTTSILLKRRSRVIGRIEEDIDFVFNKLQSLDLRLSALERSYIDSHRSDRKEK